jgi:hypothetical protein
LESEEDGKIRVEWRSEVEPIGILEELSKTGRLVGRHGQATATLGWKRAQLPELGFFLFSFIAAAFLHKQTGKRFGM